MLQQEEVLFANNPNLRQKELEISRRSSRQLDNPHEVKPQKSNDRSNNQKFDDLINRGTTVLYKIRSFFPLDLFPKTLTIDPEKVTVKFQEFFSSGEIRSIHISNIAQVYVDIGPLFATLDIVDRVIMDEASRIKIPYLKKKEAMKARRIIQGLIIARSQQIDIGKIRDENLVKKLESLGRMQ